MQTGDRPAEGIRGVPARRWPLARQLGASVAVLPLAVALGFATPACAETPAVPATISAEALSLALPGETAREPRAHAPIMPESAGPPLVVATRWSIADPLAAPAEIAGSIEPTPPEPPSAPSVGPPSRRDPAVGGEDGRFSFGERVAVVKWETLGLAAYITAINLPGLLKHASDFDFENEGLFGKNTANLGMDKVAHAYNAYVLSDILYWRMKRKTGASAGSALASSAIAVGLDVYSELFDAFEDRSGFSVRDVGFNVFGAGLSFVRNTVPGLRDKLDFRLLIIPNRDIYSIDNKKEHFRQERFLFAVKLAGFAGLAHTPLRFLELHAGYYARGFTDRERLRGAPLERKPFVGIGINLQELLFPTSRSTLSRVARTGLEYLQVPYTAIQSD